MPPVEELVQALLDPGAYPGSPSRVTLMQTGNSLIFLVGRYVYKVKKPVSLGYLDYSTLEKRKFYCEREVTLNRRLCGDAYLGVYAIVQRAGRMVVGGEGEIIEYAIKMRYLPQERMLDYLLGKGKVSAEMIKAIARKMADFHKNAETSPTIDRYGTLEIVITNCEENFSRTERYIGSALSAETYKRLKSYTNGFIEANADLFRKRVAEGRIRDCHGDLHAAHICFTHSTSSFGFAQDKSGQADDICIYDCIEFNDRFRYCDVASEIAFLAMDLDNYGRADLSKVFVDSYVSLSGDRELMKLLNFYKCYRAYVRAKVACFTLDDTLISPEERAKATAAARKYFELAETYTA